MKKILAILFVASLICVTPANATHNVYDTIRKSAVSIFSTGNGAGVCSGTVIKNSSTESVVLTAKHCIDVFEYTFVEGIEINHIISSKNDDIAILILKTYIPNKLSAKLGMKNAEKFDKVYFLGYPRFNEYLESGTVKIDNGDSHYADMKVIPGCSGGGLYNSNAELIGVVWGGLNFDFSSEGSRAVYEPLSDINFFLKEIK